MQKILIITLIYARLCKLMHLSNFFNSNCASAALERHTDVFDGTLFC